MSFSAFAGEKTIPPAPVRYVYDEPSLLSPRAKESLFQTLSREDQKTTNQIVVAVFQSIDQEEVVDFSNRVFKAWKIGAKDKNNGVLLAIYLKERKMRFEVGYGLEPLLTDAKSKRIISQVMGPAFKVKAFDQGVEAAVNAVLEVIHSDGTTSLAAADALPRERTKIPLPRGLMLLFLLMIVGVINLIGRLGGNTMGGRRYHSGGWMGGGSSGWGGGGGGGFSGSGGSSGGGGASGDW